MSLAPAAAARSTSSPRRSSSAAPTSPRPTSSSRGRRGSSARWSSSPQCSTWSETDLVADHQTNDPSATRATRASATLSHPCSAQRGPRLRDGDPEGAQPPLQGRDPGGDVRRRGAIAEDAEDSGHMAINYGAEPLWFRFGMPPNSPLTGGHGVGARLWPTSPTRTRPSRTRSPATGTRPRRSSPPLPASRSACTSSCPRDHPRLVLHAARPRLAAGAVRLPRLRQGRAGRQVPGDRILPDPGRRGGLARHRRRARSAATRAPRT